MRSITKYVGDLSPERLALVREIAFDTIAAKAPRSLNTLHGMWYMWTSHSRNTMDGRNLASLLAVNESEAEAVVGSFLLLVAAFVGSLPELHEVPTDEQIEAGLRAAGREWGIRGARLERAVDLGTSRFGEVMRRMHQADPRGGTAALTAFWLVAWLGGPTIQGPKHLGASASLEHCEMPPVDLIVNEATGELKGSATSAHIAELRPRAKTGLWLALHWTGRSFKLGDVQSVVGGQIDEPALRKYPMYGNRATERVVGRRIIERSRGGLYRIPAVAWTWAWVLPCSDMECSTLIVHERAR